MTSKDGPSTPYRPVTTGGVGSGLLGWLHSLFAPAAPAYRGDGQPSARGNGVFGSTPVYRVPPPPTTQAPPTQAPPVEQSEPVSDEQSPTQGEHDCAQGPVTIVIGIRD
jgi:hypothetical protein